LASPTHNETVASQPNVELLFATEHSFTSTSYFSLLISQLLGSSTHNQNGASNLTQTLGYAPGYFVTTIWFSSFTLIDYPNP
jgi:hypothetical protein